MNPSVLFYLLIAILVVNYLVDAYIDFLNVKRFHDEIPEGLNDIYNPEEYQKSLKYKKVNSIFSAISNFFSLIVMLVFFFLEGFRFVDDLARTFTSNTILVSLLFFGFIGLGLDMITTPFSYYKTFVIEEKFGFNKTSITTFFLDKIKGWLISAIMGGGLLALVIWIYSETAASFWIYTWIVVAIFSIFMNMFYSKLIVPLFNKQTPLEDGELKSAIEAYAQKVGFTLNNIYIIDGSKRSTKANAYFSGFGKEKRITLFDTLIKDLSINEIVAVLAHEVGHYKKKHIIFNMIASILITGFTLFILSLLINSHTLSLALNIEQASFHIGMIVFSILYSPISEITSMMMNFISRKFEYQADNYAKNTYDAQSLIGALKKLTKKSLSNLTPHPAYVFMNYSHPPLIDRKRNLDS